jgi:hypothetical protein
MLIVPLQPIPNQTLQAQLANQACTLTITQYAYGLYTTLSVAGQIVVASVVCQNLNRIVRSAYLGFVGDLTFFDMQGNADPVYTGLGSRYQLVYLEPSDLLVETAETTE